jgi:menaquinone-9 beta-reductase
MRYDVAIIGAGPAGCAAAITLARAHRSVTVLEKRFFPRHKVCGGCLSGWAVNQLRELLGARSALPGTTGSQISFAIGRRMIRCPTEGRTHIVMRADLDLMLAEAARAAGAELRFGEMAGLVRRSEKYEVAVGAQSIEAETILLASGLGGLASKAGIDSRPFSSRMIGRQGLVSAKSAGMAPGEVQMHWLRGGYIGLAAPNETDCIVALAMKTTGLCGDEPFSALRRMNPGSAVWTRLATMPSSQIRGAAGFPIVPNQLVRANVMLIGDAAGYSEPFSGTGIGMAIYSGINAARAVIAGQAVAADYVRAMRPHRQAMWRTRMLSTALNSRIVQGLLHRSFPSCDDLVSSLVHRVHVRSAI